ncbi:cation:proton antiporter [Schleiferilactobacillus harbinensis]|uniref:cation:proton antiporter n=1 Tax=Schleiferilactobacillus harbinensis TaxID=304207 RepID=UPI0007B94E3D|nr:sodium:proton antiporter [Schleiferilactobacillus harbinensis]
MDQVFIFVLMLAAVVVANVLAKHLPKIPLPFWLIGLGMGLAIFPFFRNFTLDPSVFSFAIIAPLLFNEGQNASRLWIGRTLGNIFSLAVGLVLITVLVLGFGLSTVTFIPLALAFALIAIVTPTDASAVNAISQTNPLSEGQLLILENESLFNDAAGIVAFDLALAAFISGQFSPLQATGQFLYVAIGGILFGAIVGTLIVSLRTQLIKWGDDDPIIMTTLQLLTPLLIYFFAEELGFSGILAVVAAGIAHGVERDRLRLTSARMQIVSTNVWEMVSGILSGLVFVLLGVTLPTVISDAWYGNTFLLLNIIGLGIYLSKLVLRILWSRYLVHVPRTKHRWRDALIIGFGGTNGTITLSLAFSMPRGVTLRNELIFMAAVVIIISLVVPPLVFPLLVKKQPVANKQHVWVRRMLAEGIKAMREETEHPAEARIVLDSLAQERILDDAPNRRVQQTIFQDTIDTEKKTIEALRQAKTITDDEAHYYNNFIDLNDFTADQRIWKNLLLRTRFTLHMGHIYRDLRSVQDAFLTSPINLEPIFWKKQFTAHNEDILPIEKAGYDAVMKRLGTLEDKDNRAEVNTIRRFYRDRHRRVQVDAVDGDIIYQMFLKAFHAEYELIQDALAKNEITSELAERLQQRITFDEITYLQNRSAFQI